MKRILLCFLLVGTLSGISAQKKKAKDNYSRAVFTMNDGSEKPILFYGYTYPTESFYAFMKGSDIYNFEYKLDPEGKLLKVDAKEVKKVKFLDEYEDEKLGLERLKLKAINAKGEVTDKAYDSWQPLLYDGKIKIYGSTMYSCTNNVCSYGNTKIYLRNAKDEFAIMPIDYDRLNLLNIGRIDEKMVEAFRMVGSGCSDFNVYLDSLYSKMQDKVFRKQFSQDWMAVRKKAMKDGREQRLGFAGTQKLIGTYMMEFYMKLYTGIVLEYEKNCKH